MLVSFSSIFLINISCLLSTCRLEELKEAGLTFTFKLNLTLLSFLIRCVIWIHFQQVKKIQKSLEGFFSNKKTPDLLHATPSPDIMLVTLLVSEI